VITSYTRWLEAVIVKGTESQEVYVTSAVRTHLAGSEEAPSGVCRRRTGESCAEKSLCDKAIRLGEKGRIKRKEANLVGRTSQGTRA
jgi:hypothetical protein